MYHNVERLEHKPLHNRHPVYRAWSVEGNKWDVRWNGSTWSASENEYPFRSVRRGTLRQISEHLTSLPQIKQQV
jgi:hypothetical protein